MTLKWRCGVCGTGRVAQGNDLGLDTSQCPHAKCHAALEALREVADDARELFEIIAKGVGNNAGHRARALAWLHRYSCAAGKERP